MPQDSVQRETATTSIALGRSVAGLSRFPVEFMKANAKSCLLNG